MLLVAAVVLMGVPPPEEDILMETVCPSETPEVVPEIVTEESSAALRLPSPPSLMATEIVGAMVSTMMELLSASEFAAPGEAKVRFALFAAPLLALMVPPLSVSADVPVKSRSLELSPSCTVYVKLRVVVPDPEV